jgi:Protein of unknown function (DUF3888)
MKKLLFLAFFFTSMSFSSISVTAENQRKHDTKEMEQAFDHFMLSHFNDEINEAVSNFYKKDSVRIQYNWWDKHYDVVQIDQHEKGRELSHPYIVQFTVLTYDDNKTGQLGTDTITFGVTPFEFNREMDQRNLAASKVKLLDYKHNKPTKSKD